MGAESPIKTALNQVAGLRAQLGAQPAWAHAVVAVKAFQVQRFSQAYADVLADAHTGPAARFFLADLYAPRDFSGRDAQFARIAGPLERLFDAQVVDTAIQLAQLHALSEGLDAAMGRLHIGTEPLDLARYQALWRVVGQPAARQQQLDAVQLLGQRLQLHTRTRGLRTLLRLMRAPASAAGLGELQGFLERGFDTFKAMGPHTERFLSTVRDREQRFIAQCFETTDA